MDKVRLTEYPSTMPCGALHPRQSAGLAQITKTTLDQPVIEHYYHQGVVERGRGGG